MMDAPSSNPVYRRYKNGIQLNSKFAYRDASALCELFDLPFNVCFLDRDSQIQRTNDFVVNDYGFVSTADAVNKTVCDVVQLEYAQMMLRHNDMVMNQGKLFVFEEEGITRNEIEFSYLVVKMPVYREQDIVGLLDFAFNAKRSEYPQLSQNLTKLMSTKIFGFNLNDVGQKLQSGSRGAVDLTAREEDILRLIVRGKTAKEIAVIYHLSFRTIQHIIDRVKVKTDCPSKAALIEYALEHLF